MAYITNNALDAALNYIRTNSTHLYICSTEPATYAQALTYALGNKASPTIAVVADRSGGGRKIAVSAISDGSVTSTGTANYYALVNSSSSELLATGPLHASISVSNGQTFLLSTFDIGIPDGA